MKVQMFCTAITCIEGQIQLPIHEHVRSYFKTEYVDMITEFGAFKALAASQSSQDCGGIIDKIQHSIRVNKTIAVALVGHADCLAYPKNEEEQIEDIRKSVEILTKRLADTPIVGFWFDSHHILKPLKWGESLSLNRNSSFC